MPDADLADAIARIARAIEPSIHVQIPLTGDIVAKACAEKCSSLGVIKKLVENVTLFLKLCNEDRIDDPEIRVIFAPILKNVGAACRSWIRNNAPRQREWPRGSQVFALTPVDSASSLAPATRKRGAEEQFGSLDAKRARTSGTMRPSLMIAKSNENSPTCNDSTTPGLSKANIDDRVCGSCSSTSGGSTQHPLSTFESPQPVLADSSAKYHKTLDTHPARTAHSSSALLANSAPKIVCTPATPPIRALPTLARLARHLKQRRTEKENIAPSSIAHARTMGSAPTPLSSTRAATHGRNSSSPITEPGVLTTRAGPSSPNGVENAHSVHRAAAGSHSGVTISSDSTPPASSGASKQFYYTQIHSASSSAPPSAGRMPAPPSAGRMPAPSSHEGAIHSIVSGSNSASSVSTPPAFSDASTQNTSTQANSTSSTPPPAGQVDKPPAPSSRKDAHSLPSSSTPPASSGASRQYPPPQVQFASPSAPPPVGRASQVPARSSANSMGRSQYVHPSAPGRQTGLPASHFSASSAHSQPGAFVQYSYYSPRSSYSPFAPPPPVLVPMFMITSMVVPGFTYVATMYQPHLQ